LEKIVIDESSLGMLFNKRIQRRTLKVRLREEDDLEVLTLFLKKIKLYIDEIKIYGVFLMTKEDFELIKP
jgi:hypothetical protein